MSASAGFPDVIVDRFEKAPEIVEFLKEEHGMDCREERLPAGDYRVGGEILVERKRGTDFEMSLTSGRLFAQAGRLAASRFRPVLLLECLPEWTGVSANSLQGAVLSLILDFGIPVIRSSSKRESAFLLAAMHRRQAKGPSASVRPGYRPRRVRNRALFVVTSLPGVGRALGEKALRHFGCLRGAFAADEKSWRTVQGIGKSKAGQIRALLDAGFDGE